MKRALFILLALAPAAQMLALAADGNPLDAIRLEDLAATRDRPLFAPTRRPPPAPVVAPPAPEPTAVEEKAIALGPPPFDLVGAVVGAGTAIALLRDRTTAKVVRLRPGDDAEGWRVGAIGLRSVALERDGRKESLALAAPSAAPEAPPGSELAGEPSGDAAAVPPSANVNRAARRNHDP